mgnify:CR=1 FL=1
MVTFFKTARTNIYDNRHNFHSKVWPWQNFEHVVQPSEKLKILIHISYSFRHIWPAAKILVLAVHSRKTLIHNAGFRLERMGKRWTRLVNRMVQDGYKQRNCRHRVCWRVSRGNACGKRHIWFLPEQLLCCITRSAFTRNSFPLHTPLAHVIAGVQPIY